LLLPLYFHTLNNFVLFCLKFRSRLLLNGIKIDLSLIMRKITTIILKLLLCTLVLSSCKSGAVNLFKPASPHEQYQRKLTTAGLDQTAMGLSWSQAAKESIQKAIPIQLPYRETGYFAAERVPAAAYSFKAKQGQKISVTLEKPALKPMTVYLDVWEVETDGSLKLLTSADTIGSPLQFDADEETKYIIRLQPELLRSGSYTLQITTGPSLQFPIGSNNKPRIESLFGVGRDANSRKHEGIDIFSKFHTPVLASANGIVTRVNENNLGGKVVWLRPDGKNYTLYYAHLDRQIATEGQIVRPGDTLGLVGNTGNARTTPPHLHFGIYTNHGAVNPLPYVKQVFTEIPAISNSSLADLNQTVRTTKKAFLLKAADPDLNTSSTLPASTILHVNGAYKNYLKVELPDGTVGFILNSVVSKVNKPIKTIKINDLSLTGYDQPNSLAAVKIKYIKGTMVSLLGMFGDYSLVSDDTKETSWISTLAI
jgi:murein DD-endopeptidase MepM/ murein hydrolase activator NlpD